MAEIGLTVQEITPTGLKPTFVAANAGGNFFSNDGRVYLEVKNDGSTPVDVTINSIAPCNYGFDHDLKVAVSNGEARKIGPFQVSRFNDAGGKAHVSYSGITDVTVGVFKL
jgi:hypothetical protein